MLVFKKYGKEFLKGYLNPTTAKIKLLMTVNVRFFVFLWLLFCFLTKSYYAAKAAFELVISLPALQGLRF